MTSVGGLEGEEYGKLVLRGLKCWRETDEGDVVAMPMRESVKGYGGYGYNE